MKLLSRIGNVSQAHRDQSWLRIMYEINDLEIDRVYTHVRREVEFQVSDRVQTQVRDHVRERVKEMFWAVEVPPLDNHWASR